MFTEEEKREMARLLHSGRDMLEPPPGPGYVLTHYPDGQVCKCGLYGRHWCNGVASDADKYPATWQENERLRARVAELERDIEAQRMAHRIYRESVPSLTHIEECARTREDLARKLEECARLEAMLNVTRDSLHEASVRGDSLANELGDARIEIASLRRELRGKR
jgi:hypothetical protein